MIYTVPWYPNEFPKEHEAVTVLLDRVDEMGIWVKLLEYASKEGMIPLGQYTTRKTRRVPKNVKVGKIDTALVSQVDTEKGNMDLTRQGLKENEIEAAQKKFSDYKSLMNMLLYVSKMISGNDEKAQMQLQDLVTQIVYPLHEKYENAYIALQKSYKKKEILDELNLNENVKKILSEQIEKMFTPTEVRIHGLFEAEVLTPAGVDALREALVAGYDVVPENKKLSITVIAPPVYSISLDDYDQEEALNLVNKVLNHIKSKLEAVKGRYHLKEEPRVINLTEIAKFQAKLDDIANQADPTVDIDDLTD